MTTINKNAEQLFTQKYLKAENLVNDYLFEMEVVPHMSTSGFYAYSKLGKKALELMDASNTYGDRGVHDAQSLIYWLQYINEKKDSEFTAEIIVSLTCFIMEAFERRFRSQQVMVNDQFIITLPTSGRVLTHLDNVNYATIYRNQLCRNRDYLLRQVCTPFHHHWEYGSEIISENFIATNEYFYLSSSWPDKLTALDDYTVAVAPSVLDRNQLQLIMHTVAGIIKERSNNLDWSVSNPEEVIATGTIPNRINQAVIEQIVKPNQTAVFDLVKSLSTDFNPPSEVIGFEDSIYVNPEDDKGVLRERFKMIKEFGIPPSLGLSTMFSGTPVIDPYTPETKKNHA